MKVAFSRSPCGDLSLTETLARLGWRHEPGHPNAEGRIVYDETGACLGQITAYETWQTLRDRGLVPS